MSLAIVCVYCGKPLLDADHARTHVVSQCSASPAIGLADALVSALECDTGITGLCTSCLEQARAALRSAGRLP